MEEFSRVEHVERVEEVGELVSGGVESGGVRCVFDC